MEIANTGNKTKSRYPIMAESPTVAKSHTSNGVKQQIAEINVPVMPVLSSDLLFILTY